MWRRFLGSWALGLLFCCQAEAPSQHLSSFFPQEACWVGMGPAGGAEPWEGNPCQQSGSRLGGAWRESLRNTSVAGIQLHSRLRGQRALWSF